MVRKVYLKLTTIQRAQGIIFTSTLSKYRQEQPSDTTHVVYQSDPQKDVKIGRLLDDKFFNQSHFKYNIVRT